MSFWTTDFGDTSTTGLKDPKRKFRFQVQMTGLSTDTLLWYAKTVSKPSFTIAAAEHKYLNHTFYYPGSITWNDVVMTLVDPVNPDAAATFSNIMQASGYAPPPNSTKLATISKSSAAGALGQVKIIQYDGDGAAVETWTLNNSFMTEVKYGDMAYGEDDLSVISVTLKYDWATVELANVGAGSSTATTFFDKVTTA